MNHTGTRRYSRPEVWEARGRRADAAIVPWRTLSDFRTCQNPFIGTQCLANAALLCEQERTRLTEAQLASMPVVDYLRPIIADGDTGHGYADLCENLSCRITTLRSEKNHAAFGEELGAGTAPRPDS